MNKKRIKQQGLIVIAAFLAVLLIAGCAKKENSATTPSTSASAPASSSSSDQPSAEPLEEVTLKFYFGGEKKSDTDAVWKAISEKYKDQLNVKFDINFIPFNDYKDKMMVMSASGDRWDANFDGDWLAFPGMASKGAYMPLNDLLPKYAPTLYKKYQDLDMLSAATSNGNILALPWTMKQNVRPFVVWRSDLAEQAGLDFTPDSIKTLEDYEKLLEAFHAAYPDKKLIIPGNDTFSNLAGSLPFVREEYRLLQHGYVFNMNDPKVTVIPIEDVPELREQAKLLNKWYKSGYIPSDAIVDKTDMGSYYKNGELIINISTHEASNLTGNEFKDPSWTQASSQFYPDKKFYNRTPLANVFAINKNSKNPERVLMFMELLETDQTFYDMVLYGIEGQTYKLDGEMAAYPDGITAQTSNYLDWTGQWAFWKPQFMRPTAQYPAGFWVREAEFASQSGNIANPVDGLFLNTDNVKNEVAQREQLAAELGKPLAFGVVDDVDKAIDDFTAKLKKAGSDKIAAEFQKQVDAFLMQK